MMDCFLVTRTAEGAIVVEGPSEGDRLKARAVKRRMVEGESAREYENGWIVLSRAELERLQAAIGARLRRST